MHKHLPAESDRLWQSYLDQSSPAVRKIVKKTRISGKQFHVSPTITHQKPSASDLDGDTCTPAMIRQLGDRVLQGWIAPKPDGLGGYLVWFRITLPGTTLPVWTCLTHEDGAPLRFPDAVKAREKAIERKVNAVKIVVRWPPYRL